MAAEWHRKKYRFKKTWAPWTVVHRRPGNPGVQVGTRGRHIICPLRIAFVVSGQKLQSAAGLIRFFCQLEQYPHQFGVIQWLLAAEEPIIDKTHHRRLGSAKFG